MKGGLAMQEKRKWTRLPGSLNVRYRSVRPPSEGISVCKNFCREGLGLQLDKRMEIGTILELELSIPDYPNPIFATAMIAWQKGARRVFEGDYDSGLRIIKIDENARQRLLEHVYDEWCRMQ
jgi:hypothetical protein